MADRNDDCTTCGGFGYTVDTEGTQTGCFECYVAAQEADQCPQDDRGHEYEYAALRCTHCNSLHPDVAGPGFSMREKNHWRAMEFAESCMEEERRA